MTDPGAVERETWVKDTPLKVGLHPPEQCVRGRTDCRSLQQVISSSVDTFICCGEVKPGCTPEPRDKWALCVKGAQDRGYCAGTDIRIFIDEKDMANISAVLTFGLSAAIDHGMPYPAFRSLKGHQ